MMTSTTEKKTYTPMATHVEYDLVPPAQVVVDHAMVQERQKVVSSQFAHLPGARDLKWQDDYYDNEQDDDVVAVLDIDTDTIQSYKKSKAYKLWFLTACLGFSLLSADGLDFAGSVLATLALLLALIFFALSIVSYKKVRSVRSVDIHLAITTTAVRYDQVPKDGSNARSSEIHQQLPLSSIVKCDSIDSPYRPFLCCGKRQRVEMLALHIQGSRRPVAFAGVANSHAAQKLVVALQNNRNDVLALQNNRNDTPHATAVVAMVGSDGHSVGEGGFAHA